MSAVFDPELDPALKVGEPGHYWLASDEPLRGPECDELPCTIHARCIDCGCTSHWGAGEASEGFGQVPAIVEMGLAVQVGGVPHRCWECRST